MSETALESAVDTGSTSTPASEDVSSASLVTPELQQKFDDVFKGSSSETDSGPATPEKARPANQGAPSPAQRRQQRANRQILADRFAGEPTDQTQPKPEDFDSGSAQSIPSKPQAGPAAKGQEGAPASTLDPVLRQAALRNKWEPEVIEEFYASNPELATQTFTRLHNSLNELSRGFAQLGAGRGQPQQQNLSQHPQQNPQQQQTGVAPVAMNVGQLMQQVYQDPVAVGKRWGEAVPELIQPIFDKVIAPMTAQLAEAMEFVRGQQQLTIQNEVNQFHKGLEKDFADVYGKDGQPTQEQLQARGQLYQLADQISTGAKAQGYAMSVSEALDRAHLMIASDYIEANTRKKLAADVKRRSASITAKPQGRRTPQESSSAGAGSNDKSVEAAMQAYARKAAELGIEIG